MSTVLNDQDSSMLANSINHYQHLEHHEKMNLLIAEQEMIYVKAYNLIPFKDGNAWCVLLGENQQEGIVGFGDSPLKAIIDFNNNFTKSKKK